MMRSFICLAVLVVGPVLRVFPAGHGPWPRPANRPPAIAPARRKLVDHDPEPKGIPSEPRNRGLACPSRMIAASRLSFVFSSSPV